MPLTPIARAAWPQLMARLHALAPEAFDADGHVLNLIGGSWGHPGRGKPFLSAVDGSALGSYPMLGLDEAVQAVRVAALEAGVWAKTPVAERQLKVTECVNRLRDERELLALLLVWEIGKPYQLALVDVDRCLEGVEWYVEKIGELLAGRKPLGVVSNIASWNYPMSVLMHSVLVQVLCGNATISKTPSDGGLYTLTAAHAIARTCGLPVSLVSGSGSQLSEALVLNDAVDCLAFVGGKSNGREIAARLTSRTKRYMLEMEGVNAYGVWNFSDWPGLAKQVKKGFEYGKQRCTAYVRWVVQRSLLPQFLEMYLGVLGSIRVGHPLLAETADGNPPVLDIGPLINAGKVELLSGMVGEAVGLGGLPIYQGRLDPARFLPDQDTSAYFAPAALLNVPRNSRLYHEEPFGPVDTIVVVDRLDEMVAEMNVSNGSLVASIACDDPATAARVKGDLRAFKVGINTARSRGDREEVFGGIGLSWKGHFVGGRYLVEAVTQGPPGGRDYGNFQDYTLVPDVR